MRFCSDNHVPAHSAQPSLCLIQWQATAAASALWLPAGMSCRDTGCVAAPRPAKPSSGQATLLHSALTQQLCVLLLPGVASSSQAVAEGLAGTAQRCCLGQAQPPQQQQRSRHCSTTACRRAAACTWQGCSSAGMCMSCASAQVQHAPWRKKHLHLTASSALVATHLAQAQKRQTTATAAHASCAMYVAAGSCSAVCWVSDDCLCYASQPVAVRAHFGPCTVPAGSCCTASAAIAAS
ncbi:hypothetical protein COO60DRAFT_963005 [Scenedesmus sp. NREL 46B-D3]|nr:hypothetical protein COO60DRAFT_963005 [Scenedesmus sp. NREL 46B-D3]